MTKISTIVCGTKDTNFKSIARRSRNWMGLFIINTFFVNAQVLTIDSISSSIRSSHPELKMYDAQVKSMDAYASGASAWEAPKVGGGFFMTPYNTSMWNSDNKGNNGMGSFMLTAEQAITNPAKLKANERYMKAMSKVESNNKGATQNMLISEAKTYYASWQVLKKKQKVLLNNEALINYIIKTTEIRYAYNQEKLNTVYKAKASLAENKALQLMVENDIRMRMIELNKLMNWDKSTLFEIDTTITIKGYETEMVDTVTISASRSDVKAIESSIMLNRYKQKYEQSKSKPDFGVTYWHMFSFGNNPNLFSLMGTVSIPIAPWSSKMYKAANAGLVFQEQAYNNQRESILNETMGRLSSLKSQIASKKAQLKLYEGSILPALQKNYKATLSAYEQDTEDLFVVLDARQSLQMTQLEYYNQLLELLLLQVEYEKEIELK